MNDIYIVGKVLSIPFPAIPGINEDINRWYKRVDAWQDRMETALAEIGELQSFGLASGARGEYIIEFSGDRSDEEYITFVRSCLRKARYR